MEEPTIGDSPVIETTTHVYFILPVDRWPAAAQFVAETVGPDTPFPNDPENTSVLVAVNRETLAIEGVLCAMRRLLIDHWACKPGAGVSYAAMHELIRAALPDGSVYYTVVADSIGGRHAADRAGLMLHGLLALTVTEGAEGDDGVDRTGGNRDRQLPSGE